MREPDNRATARQAGALIEAATRLRNEITGGVLQRMDEASSGLAAARTDRGRGAQGDHADPVFAAYLRSTTSTDLAAMHRAELDRCMARAASALRRALELAPLYPEPHPADEAAKLALARINDRAEPGCQNCERIKGPAGTPLWTPIDSRLMEATTVGGRLPEPWLLCVWCHDKVRLWGRRPSESELERYHAGQRVTWPADVPRPETGRSA